MSNKGKTDVVQITFEGLCIGAVLNEQVDSFLLFIAEAVTDQEAVRFDQGVTLAVGAHDGRQRSGDGKVCSVGINFTDLGITPGRVNIGDFVEIQHFSHGCGIGFSFQICKLTVIGEQLPAESVEDGVDVGTGGGNFSGGQAENGGNLAAVFVECVQCFDPVLEFIQCGREFISIHAGCFHQIFVDEHNGIGEIVRNCVNTVGVVHLIENIIIITFVEFRVDHVFRLLNEFTVDQGGDPADFAVDQINAHAGAEVVGECLDHAVVIHGDALDVHSGVRSLEGVDGLLLLAEDAEIQRARLEIADHIAL